MSGATSPAGRGPGTGSRRRTAWVAGGVALVLIALVGIATDNVWASVVLAGIALVSLLIAQSITRSQRRSRQAAFAAGYGGSLDAVRATIDLDRLRALRVEKGELHAVTEVRRQHPELTLEQAVEIVRGL